MENEKPPRSRLKPLSQRRPDEKLSHAEALKMISDDTGFTIQDIREVLLSFGKVARNTLLEGKQVYFPLIGTAYPIVRVGCYSPIMEIKKGGDGITAPQFVPKFHFNAVTKKLLKEKKVSKELEMKQFKDK